MFTLKCRSSAPPNSLEVPPRSACQTVVGRSSHSRLAAAAAAGGPQEGGAPRRQAGRQRRAVARAAAASLAAELAPEAWSQYEQQQQVGGSPLLLPLLVLPLCQLPTETLTLPVQEACYRHMFGLVEGSASRLFGATLADPGRHTMESVGALCELTHVVHVSQQAQQEGGGEAQEMLLVAARVVGRFQTDQVLASEPFVTVRAREYADGLPADEWEELQLAALEQRVWEELLQVFSLGNKLQGLLTGQLAARLEGLSENEEILRWSPSSAARDSVVTAASADTALLAQVGQLGDPSTLPERTTEHLCLHALRPVSEDGRRERFSFALASSLGLTMKQKQQLMYSQSTAERLHTAEAVLLEWRSHLAACAALHSSMPPEA